MSNRNVKNINTPISPKNIKFKKIIDIILPLSKKRTFVGCHDGNGDDDICLGIRKGKELMAKQILKVIK